MLLHGKLVVGQASVPSYLGAPILNLFYWTPLPSSFRCIKLGSGSLSLKPTYIYIYIYIYISNESNNIVFMGELPCQDKS